MSTKPYTVEDAMRERRLAREVERDEAEDLASEQKVIADLLENLPVCNRCGGSGRDPWNFGFSACPSCKPLRWHFGPTETDPDASKMWCYACEGEVWTAEEGSWCLKCKAFEEDEAQNPKP